MIIMRMSKTCALVISVVFAHSLVSPHPSQGGSVPVLFTQTVIQSSANPEDDLECVQSGNQTGQFSQFRNAFPTPNSVTVSYDTTNNTTIVDFAGQPIAGNAKTMYTFGFAINVPGGPITSPGNIDGYWTASVSPPAGHVPDPNITETYNAALQQAKITITNDPGSSIILSSVKYGVSPTQTPLNSLDPTGTPPGTLLDSGIPLNSTLASGASVQFTVTAPQSEYIIVDVNDVFGGSSPDNNPSPAAQYIEFDAVPEPASWVLMVIGTATLLGRVVSRRGVRVSGPTTPPPAKTPL